MNSAALDPETKISGFLKVSAIKGNDFPGVSWPKQAGRYYVTVAVNNEMQKTTASTKNSAPTWIETFFFNARGTSVLHLQVFSERNFVKDDYVGELEENVQSLLASANNGVITRTLGKKDSRGVLRSIHAGIKFEILTVEMLPGGGTSIGESCFGVHVLIPGVEPIDVDIVAIHGLDGHSKHSWTTKTGTLWLRDLLPEKVPHARVLTYGYDAYTRGRKQLTSESIYDLAKDLLSSLALERQITNTEQRPIIFVAHSLGGIVLKYALINANAAGRHHNSHHKALELSTYGVLFLGTPHQGARGINLALLMLRIQSIYSNTNDAVLKDLGLHSKALQQQLDLYSAISHRYSTKFYYEVYPTKLFAGKSIVLVDQYSATIPGVQNAEIIALKKDHVGIAKFNQGDGDFKTVAGHLCLMTRLAPAMIVERWEEHRLYDGSNHNSVSVNLIPPNTTLNLLPYADGASWNSENVQCLNGTRTVLLENIWSWIKSIDAKQSAEVYCLTGVAGAGKSIIVNTIARRCEREGLLVSPFFFDRDFPERKPEIVFSTIARNIADLHVDFRKQLISALESKRALVGAPISLHFEELILKPSRRLPINMPVVIIIDGLDEGNTAEILKVLRDGISKLPGTFRILLTSRMMKEFLSFLTKKTHVQFRSIDICDQTNLHDIAIFTQHMLKTVAVQQNLEINWPDQQLLDELTRKAEGLFLWVATICRYLCRATNPDKMLKELLSNQSSTGLQAELKMDEIYSTILQACDWDDDDFREGYFLVMGAILAAKTPLSKSALQSLHRSHPTLRTCAIVSRLGSLLTGNTDDRRPVRVLHLSLRDFLISRAQSLEGAKRFYICEREHSKRFALLCLTVLNEDLKPDTPGVGYLIGDSPGIPTIADGTISEELRYACRFWMDHIVNVNAPVPTGLIEAFSAFVSTQVTFWMELVTSQGTFKTILELRQWVQRMLPCDIYMMEKLANPSLGEALLNMAGRLSYMDRREQAVYAVEKAVELYRWLVTDRPAVFDHNLANALNCLSASLFELGRREEALLVNEEAVRLFRRLAADGPADSKSDLLISLNNLSTFLSELGRREDALFVIEETVDLSRQLTKEQPKEFTPHLAMSLNHFSNRLVNLHRREDALFAIQEAVVLYLRLAIETPAVFISSLAISLDNLSTSLSGLGLRENALVTINDAISIYRRLTVDRPGAFNPHLSRSLNNLANCLVSLHRPNEALIAVKEAVELRRRLAADRPASFDPGLALCLETLSTCLSELGCREDALYAIEEAVQLNQRLAADCPAAFNPHLMKCLHHFSHRLSELNRGGDALHAIKEATDLCRQLAADHPAVFDLDLVSILDSLSKRLYELGRQAEALPAIEEIVEIYRQLAADRPAAFKPDLAMALDHLSICLFDLSRLEDALLVMQEAVRLYRQLTVDHPAVFNPHLATSLGNLFAYFSALGRRENALHAIEEVVEIYRRLAVDRPDTFNLNLVASCNHLAACHFQLGRRDEALLAIKEAVELCRRLAVDLPITFNVHLAKSLNNLSAYLCALGCQQDALFIMQEAVELYRWLPSDCPATFNSDLATALDNLSGLLSKAGRREDALLAIEEAVECRRQLAAHCPNAANVYLAISLATLSTRLSELGRREDALHITREAVETYRRFAADHPAMFDRDLAMLLNTLSNCFSDLGRREEAALAIGEAVELHRRLAVNCPDAFNPDLAISLNNLSACYAALDRRKEALLATEEAIKLYRRLAIDRPETFNPLLALSLNNLSAYFFALGRADGALLAIQEAVELYRRLTVDLSPAFKSDLAVCLKNLEVINELGCRKSPWLIDGLL